jgi:4-alpha-glucanotransferase
MAKSSLKNKGPVNDIAFMESAGTLERSAGVLLHITSLPSAFGVGDLGPEAYLFANFLKEHSQRYWQILPLNTTGAAQGYSPYSSTSCMAGNTLLISPQLLVNDALLDETDLSEFHISNKGRARFEEAARVREILFAKAYDRFKKSDGLRLVFIKFMREEAYWLDDYALYVVIKKYNDNKPWYEWPAKYKHRDAEMLLKFSVEYGDDLIKEKWLQFIFFRQWYFLKDYCNSKNIQMFGDIPFYVSHDSADVWAHRDIFCLSDTGEIKGIAGVPPDYFNSDGQLWGMPVFRWDVLREQNYDWWVKRIRKNISLFDLVRFDHFRAFSSYWEVPSGEKTAVNGKWKQGPGAAFFDHLKKVLGKLPFVAEDLGDIDAPVYQLRDEFALPGMKVLQFAFSENMPLSDHIPHNFSNRFIVYTGTHDNNTTLGWFEDEAGRQIKKNLKRYLGRNISKRNVHKCLIRLAYASTAVVVIIPMQDLLGLTAEARMNTPASSGVHNWSWRMRKSNPQKLAVDPGELATFFNRVPEVAAQKQDLSVT